LMTSTYTEKPTPDVIFWIVLLYWLNCFSSFILLKKLERKGVVKGVWNNCNLYFIICWIGPRTL
jgi:hypothetical protein